MQTRTQGECQVKMQEIRATQQKPRSNKIASKLPGVKRRAWGLPHGRVVKFTCSGPGFHWFRPWAQTWHRSLGHAEVASHLPQLEGPTTNMYNYVPGGLGEKKQEKKLNLLKKSSQICRDRKYNGSFQELEGGRNGELLNRDGIAL